MGNFRKLIVWQIAKDIAVSIYKITNDSNFPKDFGFKDQIQRAAVSIASNIAEGDELGTNRQSVRHFYIARGSTAELITQIIIASEIGYASQEQTSHLMTECNKLSSMISKLIKSRNQSGD
jgi:four helix bundle protein